MSSQRGNVKRERGQKHQNKSGFKNNLHDTSKKTQIINTVEASGCCQRCKEVIEWKIKYKKYKLLSQPKKCVKCEQKTVKKNYYTVCDACAAKSQICAKCGQEKDIAVAMSLSASEEASQKSQLASELKGLTERQRRTFYRLQDTGQLKDLHDKGFKDIKLKAGEDTSDDQYLDDSEHEGSQPNQMTEEVPDIDEPKSSDVKLGLLDDDTRASNIDVDKLSIQDSTMLSESDNTPL